MDTIARVPRALYVQGWSMKKIARELHVSQIEAIAPLVRAMAEGCGKSFDPSGPRLWADLDGVLNGTWGNLPLRAVAVDTGGHHTKTAYEFCRTHLARRVWAIKGRGGPGIPIWPRRPTRTNKGKLPLFIVGVDAVKDAVYARLKMTERVVTRFEKGRPIRSWQPKRDGERNEALDTFVYAHAALHGLISMGMQLNEEVATFAAPQSRTLPAPIRSAWMG